MNFYNQYEIIDRSFRDLILANVRLEKISKGHLWTEGPVWLPAHNCLLFSDIPGDRIYRYLLNGHVSVFREQSNFANGNTLDLQCRLVTCQHGTRSVTRTEHDGTIITLANSYKNKSLNSPNDLVVKSDGSIWFTDPTYGILTNYEGHKAESEQDNNYVFCLELNSGELHAVASNFTQPNGLAFSPNETKLYVVESGHSHDESVKTTLHIFDVEPDNTLKNGREFAVIHPGTPDGLRVDSQGNVWVSAADGVHCLAPNGDLIGKIFVPETVSNLTFGGPRRNMLFITATTSVYAIYVNVEAPTFNKKHEIANLKSKLDIVL